MNHFIKALIAGTLIVSGSTYAHQERLFDAGKSAYFKEIANSAKDRAKMMKRLPKSAAKCEQGFAAGLYPCKDIDMLSYIDIGTLGVTFVNDIWGWTDPETDRDYALLGASEGTIVIDVSKPRKPVIKGMLPTTTNDRLFWRDIKVYQDHAFIISEDTDHGMQVLDLRQVRDLGKKDAPEVFEEAAHYAEFSSAHNIAINEDSGFAYVVGADTCLGGLEIVDISNPADPQPAACFDSHGYVHDTQCVIYQGDDERFSGREICFNSSANAGAPFTNTFTIVDVTDKNDIRDLANVEYGTGFGYSHQGWLTPDQSHFLHGDELDEFFSSVPTTTTRVWNVESLTEPHIVAETTNGTTSIDHNMYTEGHLSYASNYTSGLRIFDITHIDEGIYRELAFFDMYPENDNATFEGGTWSNYAYFKDKHLIAVSSMDRGLYLLRPRIEKEHDHSRDDVGE